MQEILQVFAIEAFLHRLVESVDRDRFVLKGGALLPAFGGRRPTRDIDFQATSLPMDQATVLNRILHVASFECHDGVTFDDSSASATTIRNDDPYVGIRVYVRAHIATAVVDLRVDVGIADPIIPEPRTVDLPRLLGGSIQVLAYPLEMVLAEKIVTAISRGTANTRWRDFWDVVSLSRRHVVQADVLTDSLRNVADFRQVELMPLSHVLVDFHSLGQSGWASWRRRNSLENSSPRDFGEVLAEYTRFADPVVRDASRGTVWDPGERRWIRHVNEAESN